MGSPIWRGAWQSRSLSANELDYWRARLEALEGGLKTFRGYSLSRCRPIAHPNGFPYTPIDGRSAEGDLITRRFSRDRRSVAEEAAISVARTGSATYFDAQGVLREAPPNTLRFDHDPVTLAPLGVLREGQRTNLCRQSQNFAAAVWNEYSSADYLHNDPAVQAPDGSFTASRIQRTGASTLIFRQGGGVLDAAAGTQLAGSVFAYYPEGPAVSLNINDDQTTAHAPLVPSPWWQRLSFQLTKGSGGSTWLDIEGGPPPGANVPFWIWGAQVEEGPFVSSYIPTTTASVTRQRDALTLMNAGVNDWTLVFDTGPSTSAGISGNRSEGINVPGPQPNTRQWLKSFSAVRRSEVPEFDGIGTLHTVGPNRNAIRVDGLTGVSLQPGDLIQIGDHDVHRVMETAIGPLTALFDVRPHLWPGVAAGAPVRLLRPTCVMTIVPGSVSTSADPETGRGSVSFQGIEAR